MAFRFNPRPWRWLVLAGMLMVLGTTLSSFLTRTRERPQPRPAPAPIAPQVSQQTQAFSLSKTIGDHRLYTIQANEVTHFRDKVVLRGVSILLYGKEGERQDRIETQECEYDPAAKSLLIPGEVTMKLGIPPADSARPPGDAISSPDSVSIVTTGLVFDQTTGVASTDQEVRFRFAQGHGTARGALYDPESQQLTLRSAVHFVLSEPDSMSVRAGSLRFQRGDSVVYLAGPVELSGATRTLRAGQSEILLDERRQARRIRLEGGVVGMDRADGKAADVRARRGLLELSDRGRLSALHLEEGVAWSASSADSIPDSRPLRQGRAQRAQLFFTHPAGLLERIVATEDVQMVLRDSPGSPSRAIRSPHPPGQGVGAGTQTLSADQVEMTMAPDGKALQKVSTRSRSTLDLVPFHPDELQWRVTGQEFQMNFDSTGNLTQFAAEQGVQVVAESKSLPAGRKVSTSDHLSASLDPRTRSLTRIEQWGRYRYQDAGKQARADRAEYSANGDEVILHGEGSVWNAAGKLTASRITLQNATGRIQAEGNVSTTFFPEPSPEKGPTNSVHAVADRLQYDAATGKAAYQGHVRLWQGSNLLQADHVELDRRQHQLEARGKVYSAIPQQPPDSRNLARPAVPKAIETSKKDEPIEIRADRLLYRQDERRAVYHGNTRMRSASASVNSEQLDVFFVPPADGAPTAGPAQIERAVASGEVVVLDSGRKATADRAEYFPEEAFFRLFGKPAAVWDPQGGSTQGVRLTYRVADDRISVEGEPGLPAETRRQVLR